MQNLYEVTSQDDGFTYTFCTRFGIEYDIVLNTYPIGEVTSLAISLYPRSEPNQTDYWVKNTVIKFIADILLKDSNTIFYVCDTFDSKEDKRHLVFNSWFTFSTRQYDYVSKYDHVIVSEDGIKINSSLLYNSSNELAPYIIEQLRIELR